MKYSVTGRTWNAQTRAHDIVQTIDFERLVDATGFMALNRDWIAGMVMDRDAEARAHDAAVDKVVAEIVADSTAEPDLVQRKRFGWGDLSVEVASNADTFTVHDYYGDPVGTLVRARHGSRDPSWTVYTLNGAKAGSRELVRLCLRDLGDALGGRAL